MNSKLLCKFCEKACDGLRGLSSHERRCSQNYANKEVHGDGSLSDSLFALDRCNFTLEIKAIFRYFIINYEWSYIDCKKALSKFNNCLKLEYRANFHLSISEYFMKMIEANISPHQIGRNSLKDYRLCRINDVGEYTINNCFFDTFRNNLLTQKSMQIIPNEIILGLNLIRIEN